MLQISFTKATQIFRFKKTHIHIPHIPQLILTLAYVDKLYFPQIKQKKMLYTMTH